MAFDFRCDCNFSGRLSNGRSQKNSRLWKNQFLEADKPPLTSGEVRLLRLLFQRAAETPLCLGVARALLVNLVHRSAWNRSHF